jgi:protease-4
MKNTLSAILCLLCLNISLAISQTTSSTSPATTQTTQAVTQPSTTTTTTEKTTASNKIVVATLEGEVEEAPPGIDLGLPDLKMNMFWDQLRLIRMVKNDDTVKGLVLLVNDPALNLAQCQQIALELARLRASGKRVYIHADTMRTALYLMAIPADKIAMSPSSSLELNGLSASVVYYKGLMEKLGIDAEVEHVGSFKLAAEPYTTTQPSKYMDEQMNDLMDNLYQQVVSAISTFRGIREAKVKGIIDRGPFVAEQAKEEGLIDLVMHRREMLKKIKQETGGELVFDYSQAPKPELKKGFSGLMQVFNMLGAAETTLSDKQIAIVYVTGMVVEGDNKELLGSNQTAGSRTMRKAFASIQKDDRIKAVVLRIDSPGGSSSASEVIWQLVHETAEKKPVIVSMGSVAGSGGYYIASAGKFIYASPSTLTGSIGVVGGKPLFKGLVDKLALNVYSYSRGANATMYDTMSRLTPSQRKNVQIQMDLVFNLFKQRVMMSRVGKIADIDALATGRVYTGQEGIKLGLVDRIGTLADAVDMAAEETKLKSYDVVHYPQPKTLPEILMEQMGYKLDDNEVVSRSLVLASLARQYGLPSVSLMGIDSAAMREAIMIVEMLRKGNVLMVSPYHIVIR